MKKSIYCIAFLLMGVQLPFLSFSQIVFENPTVKSKKSFVSPDDLLINQNKHQVASNRGNSYRLKAMKRNFSYDFFLEGYDSTEYFYNSNCLLYEEFTQSEIYNFGEQKLKISYEYDANDNLLSDLIEIWDSTNWINYSKVIYEYDANNNLIEELTQFGYATNLVNSFKVTYKYDSNNNLAMELTQKWFDTIWVNEDQYIYEYDEDNYLISELYQLWDTTIWVHSQQCIYEYDANNKLILKSKSSWDGINWSNYLQETYEYNNNGNLIFRNIQVMYDLDWVTLIQHIYEYDINNNLLSEIKQRRFNDNWEIDQEHIYEYDTNNNLKVEVSRYYIDDSWDQRLYYYESINCNSNHEPMDYSFRIFPNPSNNKVTIDLGEFASQIGSVNIYNSIGQLVSSQHFQIGETCRIIDLTSFAEGIHFIQTVGDIQKTQAFVIVH